MYYDNDYASSQTTASTAVYKFFFFFFFYSAVLLGPNRNLLLNLACLFADHRDAGVGLCMKLVVPKLSGQSN